MMLPITAVRLLLVEDNPGDADLTRERLADIRDAAVELEHAPTLRDAVRILRGPLPDAIILDLNLPDSEGLDTFRRIRELAQDVPGTPVCLMVRFLKAYCHGRRVDDWRWWWRAIQKRSQA